MSLLDDVLTLEEDEEATLEEEVGALQRLISGGMWSLQGSYGRAMDDAITFGYCVLGPAPAHDAYGHRIPSRYEIVPGSRGSIGYANLRRTESGLPHLTEDDILAIEGGAT